MTPTIAEASQVPDALMPTGLGAGGVGLLWASWALYFRDRFFGERPNITQVEWDEVKKQAMRVPRLVGHARNMHKALRQIREHLDAGEHLEAKAAARMAENLSDSHFTEEAEDK